MHDEASTQLDMVRSLMDEACLKAGRKPDSVTLMAVSKTHPYDAILSLYNQGQLLYGENRVQEVQQKFPLKRPDDLCLHLIGHLQSNKVKKAVQYFDAIDSVDSLKLGQLINDSVEKPFPILLELKTAENDENKSGFPDENALFHALDVFCTLPRLLVTGLMTIGPLGADEMTTRSAFSRLYQTYEAVKTRFPHLEMDTISMGMSADFPWAIAEGSNLIRVGTMLFGHRGL